MAAGLLAGCTSLIHASKQPKCPAVAEGRVGHKWQDVLRNQEHYELSRTDKIARRCSTHCLTGYSILSTNSPREMYGGMLEEVKHPCLSEVSCSMAVSDVSVY
jgi:hypothetical protein